MTPDPIDSVAIVRAPPTDAVRPGGVDGYRVVYSEDGNLLLAAGERSIRSAHGWDVRVNRPWNRLQPKTLFEPAMPGDEGSLHITTDRVVLLREVRAWKGSTTRTTPRLRLAPLLTENQKLEVIQRMAVPVAEARAYCEIWAQRLQVVRSRRHERRWSFLEIMARGTDGHTYRIAFTSPDRPDPETLALLESRFPLPLAPIR